VPPCFGRQDRGAARDPSTGRIDRYHQRVGLSTGRDRSVKRRDGRWSGALRERVDRVVRTVVAGWRAQQAFGVEVAIAAV
jgi:hypothetical protein